MKKIIPLPLLFIVSILMYSCCIIDEGVSFNKEIYDYDKFTNNRSNIFIEYSNSSVSNKEVVDENFPKNGKLYKFPYYFKYSISINCKSPQNIILQHCYITSGNGDTLETKILLNNKYLEFYNGVEQIVDSFPTIFSLFENKQKSDYYETDIDIMTINDIRNFPNELYVHIKMQIGKEHIDKVIKLDKTWSYDIRPFSNIIYRKKRSRFLYKIALLCDSSAKYYNYEWF